MDYLKEDGWPLNVSANADRVADMGMIRYREEQRNMKQRNKE
jgi:hypothetical protein